MDALTRAATENQRRLENLLRKVDRLGDRVTWAEQRIRELSQSPPQSGGVNYDDIANRLHATAKVTSVGGITKATSDTAPGSGTIKRYAAFDPAGPTLGGLLAVDEPCYSINKDKVVNQNAIVEVIWKYGAWWVIMPDSCSHLT